MSTAKKDPFHDKLVAIVEKLPGARVDWPWGSAHCKVDDKIFVGWSRLPDGDMSVGIRVSLIRQSELLATDDRFSIAKYVGKYGGLDMRLGPRPDWREVERFVVDSYRIIASKKRVKELDAQREAPRAAKAKASEAPKAQARGGTGTRAVARTASATKPAKAAGKPRSERS